MGGTTALVVSSIALQQSNAAMDAAKDAQCKATLSTYDSLNKPTIAEQREYADCVYRIHGTGEPMSADVAIVLKIVLLIIIISSVYGGYTEYKNKNMGGGVIDIFMWAIMYGIGAFGIMVVLALVLLGLQFIFS